MPESARALRVGLAALLLGSAARAQSAADLGGRLAVDGSTLDFTPVEAVFRNADVCPHLAPAESCRADEERADDSAWSRLQDVRQVHVTWDAHDLYLGVDATLGGHALLLLLDFRPGGLTGMSDLLHWRRALGFGNEFQPDAFLAVRDAERLPELWIVEGSEGLRRVSPADYRAVATFDADAPGRSLEAAVPWQVLFPDAPLGLDPEPGAPGEPLFVLPESASRSGLRLAAVVVHAEAGLSGPDVAPDNTAGMPQDPRTPAVIDRVARVAWDESGGGPPHFVDFGAAVQTQRAARFLPGAPRRPVPPLLLEEIVTRAAGGPCGAPRDSRLLLADAGCRLEFAFRIAEPAPPVVYVSASIFSLQGERVLDLYRDRARTRTSGVQGLDAFFDPTLDRWDGKDATGRPVPGGIYVLRISAGASPGGGAERRQRAITVVH